MRSSKECQYSRRSLASFYRLSINCVFKMLRILAINKEMECFRCDHVTVHLFINSRLAYDFWEAECNMFLIKLFHKREVKCLLMIKSGFSVLLVKKEVVKNSIFSIFPFSVFKFFRKMEAFFKCYQKILTEATVV